MSRRVVWAPRPDRVELVHVAGGERSDRPEPLVRDDAGWWWSDDDTIDGAYWLRVDGDDLPDPRSPRQPAGVDGPSHVVDHSAFAWTDRAWTGRPLGSCVVYELHVGTFTSEGTFDAAIERIDHLVELGIGAVELMPVAEFPGERGWGYDGVLLFAPHHAYGGPDGLKRFVDACHGRGIAVVLDVVYNHLGPLGNHLARFGPYFTEHYRTPWGDAVNLDGEEADEVRAFFVDNAVGWIRDHHLDGLRLDAVHELVDRSAVHFLEQVAREVHAIGDQLGRQVWVIAESDLNDPRLVRAPAAGGLGLDAVWSDDFHHALHRTLTGEATGYYTDYGGPEGLARALTSVYVLDGGYSSLRRRRHGRPVGSTPRHRFLGYAQNHDQIGNRALGERLADLVGPRRAEIAAAVVLTSPFVPMLFQGEEWGASTPFQYFTDHPDAELGRAVSDGRRAEFADHFAAADEVPDPQDPATFTASTLRWSEVAASPHDELLRWHRALIELRGRELDLLADGPDATQLDVAPDGAWFRIRRGAIIVAVNLGPERAAVPLDDELERERDAEFDLVLADDPDVAVVSSPGSVSLAADSVAILRHVVRPPR